MATTLKLPFARFAAQVDTAPAEPKANYQALAARNALALQACGWREAANTAKASLVTHNFTVSHAGDEYDAYLMTGDYSAAANTEVAYAGMAAYRFTLPAAYLSGPQALVSISLPITRDRFLLPGVRVVAVLSDSDRPAASWSVVRGEASPAAVEAGYLANPATRITAALDDSGTLELDLSGSYSTKRSYLWIYLTVEDYEATWTMYSKTEPRLYAVEGSAMLVGEDAAVTFSADVEPDGGNSYGCLDLTTNEYTKWVDLTGDDVRCAYVEESGDSTIASVSLCGDVPASMSALPGWVVYDIDHGCVISFDGVSIDNTGITTVAFSMPELMAFAAKHGGVKGMKAHLSPATGYSFANLYFDGLDADDFLQLRFKYDTTTGMVTELACQWAENSTIYGGDSVLRQGFGAFDTAVVAPGACLWRSGGVSVAIGTSCLYHAVKGGSAGWCMYRGWDHDNDASLAIAGDFASFGGVACNGMCVVTYNSQFAASIARAYPLDLEFDTRRNLSFARILSGDSLWGIFVAGDFTTINGIRADGTAFVLAPESESLDPTAADYVQPVWQSLVVPLRFRVAKPFYHGSIIPFVTSQGGGSRYPTHSLMRGTVACLRRASV